MTHINQAVISYNVHNPLNGKGLHKQKKLSLGLIKANATI